MKKLFLLFALLTCFAAPAHSQARPDWAVAQDGSDSPPLENEFGPQADTAHGLNLTVGGGLVGTTTAAENDDFGNPFDEGGFRFVCMPTHVATDDPIVNYGKPGKAHAHIFFANKLTDANSTYTSLKTTGKSGCMNAIIRSGYWAPAMILGLGPDALVRWPESATVYYKRWSKNRPPCTVGDPLFVGRCVPLPNGLRNIAGYDMITGTTPNGNILWKCVVITDQNNGGYVSDVYHDMTEALSHCPTAPGTDTGKREYLDVHAFMPNCWDGFNLDSANHRSQMADVRVDPGSGKKYCPKTHPYLTVQYSMQLYFRLDGTENRTGVWTPGMETWYFSSDRMPGMTVKRPGTTYHFDLFDAQPQAIKKIWTDNCIDMLLGCAGGNLGNGTGLVPDVDYVISQHPDTIRPKQTNEAAHGVLHGHN